MRRTTVLGAAAAAALAAGVAGGPGRLRVVSPRGAAILARPDRRQHRRLRVHRAGRARHSLTVVANWIPLEDPAGGPYFGKLDPSALLRQDRQHRRRARGRALPLEVQAEVPQPELVPRRGAARRLGRRPGHQLRPDVRPLQGGRTRAGKRRQDAQARRATSRSRRPTRARRRCPDYAQGAAGAIRRCRAAARCSSARPTIRSSSISARSSTASTSTSRAARTSASATRAAARTTWRRTTRTRSSCRCRSPRSRATARPSRTRSRATPRSACGPRPSAAGSACSGAATATGKRWVQVSRLGNPLINEVDHPARPEGQVQPHVARRTT